MSITTVSPLYLKLIRRFPLRPLRSDEELEQAIAVSFSLDKRGRAALAPEERDYHDVLVTLITRYEAEHHPIPDVSGPAMLRCLIENRGLTQAAVAQGTGMSESALSEILAGRRPMGRKTIETLGGYFRVDPGLFLVSGSGVAASKGALTAGHGRKAAVAPKGKGVTHVLADPGRLKQKKRGKS